MEETKKDERQSKKPPYDQVITFKAKADLIEKLSHIQNRSEFVREAILRALDEVCPTCGRKL